MPFIYYWIECTHVHVYACYQFHKHCYIYMYSMEENWYMWIALIWQYNHEFSLFQTFLYILDYCSFSICISVHVHVSSLSQPFGVLKYKCVAGIMITASHNPKDDNGYKVYWSNGAQVSIHLNVLFSLHVHVQMVVVVEVIVVQVHM